MSPIALDGETACEKRVNKKQMSRTLLRFVVGGPIVVIALAVFCSVPVSAQTLNGDRYASAGNKRGGSSVVLVAHRGGIVPGYPENTLTAFRRTIKLGIKVIELDLRGTKDSEIVIMHDKTLNRTTNGEGNVTDFKLAELRKLDAGKGERIPTYEEVLKLVAGTGVILLLDIKDGATLNKEQVVRLTEKYNAVLNVIVGPRTLDDLRAFKRLSPNMRTLGFIKDIREIARFAEAGVDIIRLWPKWVHSDPDLVKRVQRLGRPVWVTTGNAGKEELERLFKLGINGIISDVPEMVIK